jgi:hypothetical protein
MCMIDPQHGRRTWGWRPSSICICIGVFICKRNILVVDNLIHVDRISDYEDVDAFVEFDHRF